MTKKRELDSITPDFSLTSEQVAEIKRMFIDSDYAREVGKELEVREKAKVFKLKQMIITGVSSTGRILSDRELSELKDAYRAVTGERWNEKEGS